jgi:hypothetical protein
MTDNRSGEPGKRRIKGSSLLLTLARANSHKICNEYKREWTLAILEIVIKLIQKIAYVDDLLGSCVDC